MPQFDLIPYVSLETADTFLDTEHKTFQISWKGNVDFEDYKQVLLLAVELTREGKLQNLVLNRLSLVELNVECRIWLKNDFLKIHARPVIPLLKKVATLEAKSALGRLYTNTITKTVSIVYPNLSFKSFASEHGAYEWIAEDEMVKIAEKKAPQVVDRKPIQSPAVQTVTGKKPDEKFLTRFVDFLFGSRRS